jgi:hypothetical protein
MRNERTSNDGVSVSDEIDGKGSGSEYGHTGERDEVDRRMTEDGGEGE